MTLTLELQQHAERQRVEAAYARRRHGDPRYAPDNPAHVRGLRRVEAWFRRELHRHGLGDLSAADVLEVGCGHGGWLLRVLGWGVRPERLQGVELRADAAEAARSRLPPQVRVHVGSADALPTPTASVHVVLQATVFSSIHDPRIRRRVAAEMRRVLHPRGMILWYDMRVPNPWNRDVYPMRARDIRHLFPHCTVQLRSATLLPQLARVLARRAPRLCALLERLPLLRTHYLGVIRPRAQPLGALPVL